VHGESGAQPAAPPARITRSKTGNAKPKIYTDVTVRYGLSCSTNEPETLQLALANKKWKEAMNFFEMGLPSLCIKIMHMAALLLYFE
jgi:hypothetical protein